MENEEKRTSAQWYENFRYFYPDTKILDHDGWDRNNFDYSWNEELITYDEFNSRLMQCTMSQITLNKE